MNVVLDTNIVLDWLAFKDASTAPLQREITAQRIRILVNEFMTDELRRVLNYPQLNLADERQAAILASYRSQSAQTALPPGFSLANLLLPDSFPRCKDRDDEHFLAMAYHSKADALITKDKAILKMRKQALRFGVRIASLRDVVLWTSFRA